MWLGDAHRMLVQRNGDFELGAGYGGWVLWHVIPLLRSGPAIAKMQSSLVDSIAHSVCNCNIAIAEADDLDGEGTF